MLCRVAIRNSFISANSYRRGHTPTAVVPVIVLFTAMRIQFEHGPFDSLCRGQAGGPVLIPRSCGAEMGIDVALSGRAGNQRFLDVNDPQAIGCHA